MKLRTYLALLLWGALLPVVVFSAVMIALFAQQQQRAVEEGLLDTARALAVAVDRALDSAINTLEALATSRPLDTGDLAAFYEEARRVLPSQTGWITIALFAPDNRQLLNLRAPVGAALPPGHGTSVADIVRTREPGVADLFVGRMSQRQVLGVLVPVLRGGEVRYVLGASFDPAVFSDLLADRNLPPGSLATVIDRNGVVVAHSRRPEAYVGRPGSPALVQRLRESREGTTRGPDLEGPVLYFAFSRTSLSGWSVAFGIPAAPIDARLRRSLAIVGAGGAALVGVGLVLALVLARRIARSIAALSASATALGRDEALPRLAPCPVKEVGEVAAALHEAGALLRQRRQEHREAEERRDQIEGDLRRANRAKDEFLAMLGHELRNPIGAITTAVQALREPGLPPDAAARMGGIITRQVAHLSRLVGDLLDVSRVTSGKITLKRRPVDLRAVAQRTVDTLRQAGRLDGRDVHFDGEPAPVVGDPTRLEQVVGNLLDNAAKFTPPGGRIRVSVHREADAAVLRVADSGRGIEPEALPWIFELFAQGERPLDRAQGGLGLGLTLVRRLVELHGGTVVVASDGRDRGSEFTVRLPLAPTMAQPPAPPAATEPAPPRPCRVLVIEDNADAREAVQILLEIWGHEVQSAADGHRGLAIAQAWNPQVALVDIGLPGLDGYALAGRLRDLPAGRQLFLVALTGYGQPADRQRALAAGFDAHLVKPVDADELAGVLARATAEPAPAPGP
jgi:signal transduction histidine kinase/ActR/RegA family two-component response regulator